MKSAIIFGTSGHRGIMGQDMTQRHIWAIGQAIADYIDTEQAPKSVIIGYDPREGNDPNLEEGSFTRTLIESLHQRHIHSYFCTTYTPTPVISWAIRNGNYGGGVILTASHNPPDYNGIKFNPNPGQPAPINVTDYLQEKANRYYLLPYAESITPIDNLLLTYVNPIPDFAQAIISTCTTLIPTHPTHSVAIDCKFGACASTWTTILSQLNIPYRLIHEQPLPTFGHQIPNPTDITSLGDLKKEKTFLSFANDPDGDRHIILDERGEAVSPELITTLIADYLQSLGHPLKGISTTLASSSIIQSFTTTHQLSFDETKVGFKYFFPFLYSCWQESKLGLAVESSGGFSLSTHTYEKCGFLPCLLTLFICSHANKPLSELITAIKQTYGTYYFSESSFTYDEKHKHNLLTYFKSISKEEIENVFGPTITIDKRDGVKLIGEGYWLLFRFSGTEPVIRLYAETTQLETTNHYLNKASLFLRDILSTLN